MNKIEKYLIKTNDFKILNLEIQYHGMIFSKIVLVSIGVLNDEKKYICDLRINSIQDLIGKKLIELNTNLNFNENEKIIEIYQLKYI